MGIGFGALLLYVGLWSAAQGVITHVSRTLPRTRSLVAVYATSLTLALGVATLSGRFAWEPSLLAVSFVGGYQTWGGYAQFRAYSYSLSRSSLLLPLRFVVSMALAAVFLGEAKLYQNLFIPVGALLLLAAAVMLRKQGSNPGETQRASWDWILSILGMVLIVGSAGFMMKYFASGLEVPRLTFLSYWYIGALIGSAPMLALERGDKRVLFRKGGLWALATGTLTITQLGVHYTVYQLLPLAVADPLLGFGTTLGPILVGLLVFREVRELTRIRILAFLLGGLGAALLVIGRS